MTSDALSGNSGACKASLEQFVNKRGKRKTSIKTRELWSGWEGIHRWLAEVPKD